MKLKNEEEMKLEMLRWLNTSYHVIKDLLEDYEDKLVKKKSITKIEYVIESNKRFLDRLDAVIDFLKEEESEEMVE